MATERQRAKDAITSRRSDEPALDSILSDGKNYKLELDQEANRHKERVRATDIGAVGRFIGADSHAALSIALIVVGVGLLVFIVCLIAAYKSDDKDFWGRWAERSLAAAMTALSYVFGRGERRPR